MRLFWPTRPTRRRWLHTETVPDRRRGSIFLRQVDGGSSNIFEAELTALTNPIYDLAQYGISLVASPSHADVLLLTGPLTRNMLDPVRAAFAVMPEPRAIITVGDYADFDHRHGASDALAGQIGRLLDDSYATVELPDELWEAIVAHVPGDPPEPRAVVQALLSELTRRRKWHRKPARQRRGQPDR